MVLKTCGTNIVRNVGQLWVRFSILRQPRASKVSTVRSFAGVVQNTNHPGNQSIDRRRASTSLFAGVLSQPSSSQANGGDCGGNKFAPACIDPKLVATLAEVEDLPNHPEKLLIDVREPSELEATGRIPTSINIPLKTVHGELNLRPEAFEAKYGRKKPALDDAIIFSCRSGVRAGQAAFEADRLGFQNVKNYVGSWMEYGPKHGFPV
ncbi:rhodanese domain-containing protein CG4456 isoform X2 [Anopheles bellator]|uniref:rhodanese domain-containing protein CG4456 isoform X2 n=1 Tax=Anopheles bellator TaxID=139047 RepID=UPI0026474784|nr:rhodanese domain-containing protein CG4456 isoform X2 [Anopheles bellator]